MATEGATGHGTTGTRAIEWAIARAGETSPEQAGYARAELAALVEAARANAVQHGQLRYQRERNLGLRDALADAVGRATALTAALTEARAYLGSLDGRELVGAGRAVRLDARALLRRLDAALAEAGPGGAGARDETAPRPAVLAFARLMEAQLRANDHKPGWADADPLALYERLVLHGSEGPSETSELLLALGAWQGGAAQAEWVGREAADVANFCLMIADVVGALRAGGAGER